MNEYVEKKISNMSIILGFHSSRIDEWKFQEILVQNLLPKCKGSQPHVMRKTKYTRQCNGTEQKLKPIIDYRPSIWLCLQYLNQ
jgi:hypothetical protein